MFPDSKGPRPHEHKDPTFGYAGLDIICRILMSTSFFLGPLSIMKIQQDPHSFWGPGARVPPALGDFWRASFSRVQWAVKAARVPETLARDNMMTT